MWGKNASNASIENTHLLDELLNALDHVFVKLKQIEKKNTTHIGHEPLKQPNKQTKTILQQN